MNAVKGSCPREVTCVKSLIIESKGRDTGFSLYHLKEAGGSEFRDQNTGFWSQVTSS